MMMQVCFLPEHSSFKELLPNYGDEPAKVYFFHNKVKRRIELLLGQTYLLTEVLEVFDAFSDALAALGNQPVSVKKEKQLRKDPNNKYDIYDHYFEVVRVDEMACETFIQQYLYTSAALIDELKYTSMSRGEVCFILKAWEAANLVLLSEQSPKKEMQFSGVEAIRPAPTDNAERALYRWKLAHHGFALFMIFSGYCFERAIKGIETDTEPSIVADWLDKGAHLFRATTACMEFGNSFTARVYQEVIRPDMSRANKEANLPNGFSGTQNFEYVQWRKIKLRLFDIVQTHWPSLPISVKEKMELFRAYYLEDMHIHSIIAGRMVGIEKSLLQKGKAKGGRALAVTAGDMLRMFAGRRTEETAFIVQG